ncbi:hypothetical protein K491DRAFT_691840 [Lophiostoma macrostomum CBS 122681]|uniref:Heterokaryon incompatibility domain-containing protein n=1 Tax=Lophiostoma macrostomum CBS 122681 TaxID=1314788 RepID=A0A6A6T9G9_9PLEO|nr:hypothetical protein K491DRAFT_691840 [Lophiostoma macrostomum CBS 122681]
MTSPTQSSVVELRTSRKVEKTTETSPTRVQRTLPLFSVSPKSTTLRLQTVTSLSNDEPIKYDVLSCTISDESMSTAIFDDEEIEIPESIASALSHLQLPDQSRIIFNDQQAFLRSDIKETQQLLEDLPHIHQQAEQIVIWAGTSEEDDSLSPFIGNGSTQSTKDAFEFAHRLSEAPFATLPGLFKEYDSSNEVFQWSRLQQLVYRDFLRGDPVLSSNYISSLSNVVIQVSSLTIPYPTLKTSADILLKAHPLPRYLIKPDLHPSPQPLEVPEGWSHDQWWAALAYENHLEDSIRFGYPTQLLMAQLHHLMGEANGALDSRFKTHFGFSGDIIDSRGGWKSDAGMNSVRAFHHQLATYGGDVSIEAIEDPVGRAPRPTPVFDGRKIVPTPVAAHRQMFMHSMATYDEDTFVVLLEILPDPDLNQPLQCGLREVLLEMPCEFAVVGNHMFLRPPLYEDEEDEDGNDEDNAYPTPPLASRSTTQILINNRSYPVPALQEIFLRLHRDAKESKLVHLWNVCRKPRDVGMYRSERLKEYVKTKECLLKSEVQKVSVVDMYEVLERAGRERSEAELGRLGKPEGVGWMGWLLGLAD